MGLPCLPAGKLELIYDLTRTVAEIANVSVPDNLPYVGAHAFSHKAGMHADGILKLSRSFEHIDPSLVGNERSFLMSEVGGRSAIAERARKIDPSITRDHPVIAELARKLKELEAQGWQFEGADGSFELLVRREIAAQLPAQLTAKLAPLATKSTLQNAAQLPAQSATQSPAQGAVLLPAPFFQIEAYRVVSEHPTGETLACSHAWVKVLVDGQHEIAAAEGDGPVNAMDGALRRALTRFYPQLGEVRLSDYKVRVIDGKDATAAKVRVLIESTDGIRRWTTVGVSEDIIDASRAALVDSIEYKLIGDIEQKSKVH
jgi:2-isopropylmalate synthase